MLSIVKLSTRLSALGKAITSQEKMVYWLSYLYTQEYQKLKIDIAILPIKLKTNRMCQFSLILHSTDHTKSVKMQTPTP